MEDRMAGGGTRRPTGSACRGRWSRGSWVPLGAVLLLAGCGASDREAGSSPEERPPDSELATRQSEVAAAAVRVMPFDLDRSTHVFEPLDDGGLQTVVSDDGDEEQIQLIRTHLAEEAERFARGDFHDPAMIHGDDMAGMHALVMGHDRMSITYGDVPGGGEIRYRTDDPELVAAVHEWFEAQVRDHGSHAQGHR